MATSYNLQCLICLEDFKEPKILDCQHTFCLECLRGLENKEPGFIKCPLCSRVTRLPRGGLDNFDIQVAPLVGVKDRKTVKGLETVKGRKIDRRYDGTFQLSRGDKEDLLNDAKGVSERKTIQLKGPAFPHLSIDTLPTTTTETFCGVSLMFTLFKNNTKKWGETLALRISLSNTENPFIVHQVDYDVTLVNQKDEKFSTKQTGQGSLQTLTNLDVDLIKMCHAYYTSFGFINFNRRQTTSLYRFQGTHFPIFDLDINITVSNTKNIDFNLK